jgi:hypothetical protein
MSDLLAQAMGLDFRVGAISQAPGNVAAALKAPVAEAMANDASSQGVAVHRAIGLAEP